MEISNVKKDSLDNADRLSQTGWNYDKCYYRLKYFYRINIDELLRKTKLIAATHKIPTSSVFEVSFALFNQILKGSKSYHSFLTDEGPHNDSFFGEAYFCTHEPNTSSIPYNQGFSDLIKIALMNYCVTQSFYIFAPNEEKDYIKLSGRFHNQYYRCSEKDGSISAEYTNRYAKFSNNSFFKNYILHMPYERKR